MIKDIPNRAYSFISMKPNVWNPVENEIIEVHIIIKHYTFLSSIGIALPAISGLPHLYSYHAIECPLSSSSC